MRHREALQPGFWLGRPGHELEKQNIKFNFDKGQGTLKLAFTMFSDEYVDKMILDNKPICSTKNVLIAGAIFCDENYDAFEYLYNKSGFRDLEVLRKVGNLKNFVMNP